MVLVGLGWVVSCLALGLETIVVVSGQLQLG